jgi:3-oxoacyl-[acyl-carrier protein] reductase
MRRKEIIMWGIENKTIIVTGGAKGIGRAYVEAFAEGRARVAIADIDQEAAERLASELQQKGHQVLAVKTDVSDFKSCQSLAGEVWKEWQGIHALVNNAAIYSTLMRKSFMEISQDEWNQVMAVNLRGMLFCCQAVFPYMKEQKYGKIINISSTTIFKGSPLFLHYVTSKAGVVGFTRALAREVGEEGIMVNAITPGLTDSGENAKVTPAERFKKAIADRCLKRPEYPRDLTGAVLFLASMHSDFITGQIINVDGGGDMH